ncbi:hypothetical protein XELAEV_18025127mg [Xenopus laevis]|uniref:Uncharacterized protein n=1 Tax=Xenopus laevis TaxID=8355 RepID=A0A974CYW8_XENLA|nr:hypothetical protein XELAEV_18025127mg [Xenopus laevis]
METALPFSKTWHDKVLSISYEMVINIITEKDHSILLLLRKICHINELILYICCIIPIPTCLIIVCCFYPTLKSFYSMML